VAWLPGKIVAALIEGPGFPVVPSRLPSTAVNVCPPLDE